MKVNSGKDVAEEYTSSLADLTINSKPLINMLTMLAEDYIEHAPVIVKVVELHLQKVTCDIKLPILYLIDSIVKNVGKTYIPLFTQNIVSTFCAVFEKVDEKVRFQMFKLRQTWNEVFPQKKLFALDVRVHAIDPAWPITATQSVNINIHVNPKFLQAHSSTATSSASATSTSTSTSTATTTVPEIPPPISDGIMREELLKQQKELLELQKRKVELELMQTKAILEEQQKKLENQAAGFISESVSSHTNAVATPHLQPVAVPPHQFAAAEHVPSTTTVHLPAVSARPKPYKAAGGSSLRTRDPRIKFNKEKYAEPKPKTHVSQKDSNTKEGKQHKKDKKNFKKHKDRHHTKVIGDKNEWNRNLPTEMNTTIKKQLDRYDKDLFTKIPAEEPPPPGVDVITCADMISQTSIKDEKEEKGKIIIPDVSNEIKPTVSTTKDDMSLSPMTDSPTDPVIQKAVTKVSEIIDIAMDVCESKKSIDKDRKSGGIKRNHSGSPSTNASERIQELEKQENNSSQPPRKMTPPVEPPVSSSLSHKELTVLNPSLEFGINGPTSSMVLEGNNPPKDVDFRLLPFPAEKDSEDTDSQIPMKKSRAEVLDALFGDEDVDLRTFPPMVPSPQQSVMVTSSTEDSNPVIFTSSPGRDNINSDSSTNSFFNREILQHNLSPSRNNSPSPVNIRPSDFSSPIANISPRNTITPPHTDVSSLNSSGISISPPDLNSPVASVVSSQFLQSNSCIQSDKIVQLPSTSTSFQDNILQNFCSDKLNVDVKAPKCPPPPCLLISSPPPAPPPPIISKDEAGEESSWANYKKIKSEEGSPVESFRRNSSGRKERTPSALFRSNGVPEEMNESAQESEERSSANCNLIIKEAEQQLSSGNITFSQYNRMLKEVIAINETRKLQEALRKDESNEVVADTEMEIVESDKVDIYSTNSKQEQEFNRPLLSDTISNFVDSPDKIDEDVSKSEESAVKDVRNRRHYSSDSLSRTFNTDSYSRFDSQPPVWDNRNNLQPSQSQISSQRSSWYMRATPNQMGLPQAKQMPPRTNPTNYPVWASTPSSSCNPPVYYETNKTPNYRYGCNVPYKKPFVPSVRPLPVRRQDVPPSDPHVLELIEKDTMRPIRIDGVVREVRFYGETAVIMLTWDDPREVMFQKGSRRLVIDDHDHFLLHFNAPYRDCIIDGQLFKIRLGAPTRELFIDGLYYEMIFGGPAVQIMLGGKPRKVKLSGSIPKLRIGEVPRTDLVAGKINLIVDAKQMFPIYLDAKPQRFEIGGVPYILRFVEALQTVVINGVPFKFEFGGVPVPIFFHGEKHFLRLSVLPRDIRPGYVNIVNMEGGRLPSPAPEMTAPPVPPPVVSTSSHFNPDMNIYNMLPSENSLELQPLDLLTSLMPTTVAPLVGHNYAVEHVTTTTNTTVVNAPPAPANLSLGDINVGELFQKLVASGIVPPVSQKETSNTEDETTVKEVDFAKPETLKVKQPGLVARLYSGIQCSSCGVRFPPEQTVKYSQHLDWHFRQNRREKVSAKIAQSRRWNYDVSDWIQYQEIEDVDDRAASWFEIQEKKSSEKAEDNENEPSVAAGAGAEQATCCICHDNFDQFYNEEKEEWHLKKAVRVDGVLYHPLCYEDLLQNRARIDPPEPTVLEDEELIVIDDSVTVDDATTVISDTLEDVNSKDKDDEKSFTEENLTRTSDNDVEIVPVSPEDGDNSKEGLVESSTKNDLEKCDEVEASDSDDDILQIEVVERHIESYDIDDDDEEEENDINKSNQVSSSSDQCKSSSDVISVDEDDIVDFTKVKVKTEKLDITDHISVPNHLTVVSSIDGNVELQDATPVVIPKKIKINISSKHIQQSKPPVVSEPVVEAAAESVTLEPPPPGEELFPANLKPKFVGKKMEIREPVRKGSDTSGLCSIM